MTIQARAKRPEGTLFAGDGPAPGGSAPGGSAAGGSAPGGLTPNSFTKTRAYQRPFRGRTGAPVVILCDPPTMDAYLNSLPTGIEQLKFMAGRMRNVGLDQGDVYFVGLCPPLPEEARHSDSRKWAHVQAHSEGLAASIRAMNPRLIVTMGELATRCIVGRAVKITKARGVPVIVPDLPPVLPMLSANFVLRIPDHIPTFEADLGTVARLKAANFDVAQVVQTEREYQWRHDISDLLGQNKPRVVAVDSETTGLVWWDPQVRPLVFQVTTRPGNAFLLPIDAAYCRRWFPEMTEAQRVRLLGQWRTLMEDPEVKKIGHNIKFEAQMNRKAGIHVQGWLHDTQLMAFFVDENMLTKNLDDCVRIFVAEMSGYADEFSRTTDKAKMFDVPPEDILGPDGTTITHGMKLYAGGDSDATFRLARALDARLRTDPQQLNCYRRIQLRALQVFANIVERSGISINQQNLESYGEEVADWIKGEYRALIRMVPAPVRRKAIGRGEDMKFSRPAFVKDALFSRDGFNLKPVVFTKSTRDLPNARDRAPSVSANDHFPYLVTAKGRAGEFVARLIEFQKAEKLFGTYIGRRAEGNGFWKYIAPDGKIYPSYALHKTNTGRTASENPNGQNFPKRGRFAKGYNAIFEASAGYKLVAADLSQIELRLVAWMAQEPTMLEIYRGGGDIHLETAANSMRLDPGRMRAWRGDDRRLLDCANEIPGAGAYLQSLHPGKRREATVDDYVGELRFRAKAVNFGFVYGMGAKGFQVYAKTDYGLDYTLAEAEETRNLYFRKFAGLTPWHEAMKRFAHRHGYVRALHGAKRSLPSIWSNDRAIVAGAERQAVNAPIQRFASDLGLMAMIRLGLRADPELFRMVGFIHDQIILEARDGYEEEGAKALVWCMENPPLQEWFGITPPLPIRAEPECGMNLKTMAKMQITPEKPDWWIEDDAEALAISERRLQQHIHLMA